MSPCMTRSLCDHVDDLKELAKEIWPNLASLSFRNCGLVLDTCPGNLLQALTTADWPKLQTLDFSENAFPCESHQMSRASCWCTRNGPQCQAYGCKKTGRATCNADTICHRSQHLAPLPAIQFVKKLGKATSIQQTFVVDVMFRKYWIIANPRE